MYTLINAVAVSLAPPCKDRVAATWTPLIAASSPGTLTGGNCVGEQLAQLQLFLLDHH
jgi:hypothetical protein